MRGWHERSDILGKKSKIHTLHEDILAVSEESIFSVRGDSLTEGGGCFLDMREKEACQREGELLRGLVRGGGDIIFEKRGEGILS